MEDFLNTGNINDKWLLNIYENIKKIEEYERLARNGCESIYEFANMSLNRRKIELPETQFKNIKMMVTEFILLVGDLSRMPEATAKQFLDPIKKIDKALNEREHLFIDRVMNVHREVIEVRLLDKFMQSIEILFDIKVKLFRENKDILYITSFNG